MTLTKGFLSARTFPTLLASERGCLSPHQGRVLTSEACALSTEGPAAAAETAGRGVGAAEQTAACRGGVAGAKQS